VRGRPAAVADGCKQDVSGSSRRYTVKMSHNLYLASGIKYRLTSEITSLSRDLSSGWDPLPFFCCEWISLPFIIRLDVYSIGFYFFE